MKIRIHFLLIGMFLTNTLLACTFISESFCHNVWELSEHVILSGTIISVDEDGIDVEVMDVLRGDESNEVIRIWDGTDFDCNGPWSMAASDLGQVGDVKILILPKIVEIENTWDVIGDYQRPNWYARTTDLNVVDGTVNGRIRGYSYWDQNNEIQYSSNYIDELAYDVFVSSFSETLDCSAMVDTENITNELQVAIENPFTSQLNINLENDNFEGTISIFNMNGVAIRQFSSRFQSSVSVDLSFVPSGLYFIRFENLDGQYLVEKVVKQ